MTTTKRKPAAADEPLQFADAAAWQHWLQRHHATSDGVWLRIAKKGAGAEPTVSYGEALDIALCHGWIDGRKQGGEPYWLRARRGVRAASGRRPIARRPRR